MAEQSQNYVIPEGYHRSVGKAAQRNNILAARLLAETVRTTLGPKGMDKMLVDSLGDVIVTNDGVTILNEMQIEHPVAKMVVEVAKTQEEQIGDGTTTAVIFAGELLKNAEHLLDKEIHPTVIIKGYRIAARKAHEILNSIAELITIKDEDLMKKVVTTAIIGKGAEHAKDKIAELVVNAVKEVAEGNEIDLENIKLEKKTGSGIDDSELIKGIILDKERVHSQMPKVVNAAKIALLDAAIEIKGTETDAKISLTSPEQLQAFIDQEEKTLKDMVDKISATGAKVVVCQKGIDDIAQHFFAKKGIYAVRRVKKSDMTKLAKAVGANIVSNYKDISASDLGYAGLVEAKKVGDEEMTYISECMNPKAVTILIRGGTMHVVDEVERAVKDALGDVAIAIKDSKVVAGAGAPEIEVAKQIREFANSFSGREQLAILAFADSIEVVPKTLAENAGLDPIDMLTDLKAKHDAGYKWAGLDVFKGTVVDAWANSVIEPLRIKTQAIKSASEVAELILRIDDVIAAGSSKKEKMPQEPRDM
ncbi:TCP-1/cpn60 chaperonin family protein [Candidatus Woesearchaeota archaeon]|nr:TCP-1/cpn60 chaperonin family protein [Candidatus Woesearchaeota archaeon]